MKPPVIFLDFDGVISHDKWETRRARRERVSLLDPECVHRVSEVCREHGAQIVISSAWRGCGGEQVLTELRWLLVGCGLSREVAVIGHTPILEGTPTSLGSPLINAVERKDEILAWLKAEGRRPFVVLDDYEDARISPETFVHCDYLEGFTEGKALEASSKLGAAMVREGKARR